MIGKYRTYRDDFSWHTDASKCRCHSGELLFKPDAALSPKQEPGTLPLRGGVVVGFLFVEGLGELLFEVALVAAFVEAALVFAVVGAAGAIV